MNFHRLKQGHCFMERGQSYRSRDRDKMSENLIKEYKSIQSIRSGDKGFRELAKDCVYLANAQGGEIYIGFENRTQHPPSHQEITYEEINNTVKKLRSLAFSVSLLHSDILTCENRLFFGIKK